MGVDYYKVLQVDRNAKDDDLKKAYLKLTIKWHPDNNPNNKNEAKAKFNSLSEAYDVLSDPRKRAIYDQYGEEGLKGQVPPAGAGGVSGMSSDGGSTTFRFNPRNADDIFSEFFGFSSPSGGMGDMGGSRAGGFSGMSSDGGSTTFRSNPRNADDIFSEFFESGPSGGRGDMGGSRAGGVSGMSSDGGSTTFRSNPRNADDIFSEFFGSGPSGGRGDMGGSRPRNADDIFSEFFVSSPSGGMGDMGGSRAGGLRGAGGGTEGSPSMPPRKGAAIERTLPCSLEDLYKGTTRKMKISRDVADGTGRSTTVEEILTIEIKRGWKKGTKITFPEKGNEQRGVIPSDLVFIIDEKSHAVFQRDGNDLVVTQKISLVEALTGYPAQISTLDGRNLSIPINTVISPTYEEVVEGEGMPIPKEPTKKGNLRIKFNIKFPARLTSEQKSVIKRSLTSS